MRPRLVSLPAVALLLAPSLASAQIGAVFDPVITVPVLEQVPILNVQRCRDDDVFTRSWSAQVTEGETFRFELTHKGENDVVNQIVDLDSGAAEGNVVSNQTFNFSVRATELLQTVGANASRDAWGCPTDVSGSISLTLRVFRASDPDNEDTAATFEFEFDYDLDPPSPPTVVSIVPGENRVQIGWKAPETEKIGDLKGYTLVFQPDLGEVCTTTIAQAGLGFAQLLDLFDLPADTSSTALDPDTWPGEETGIATSQDSFSVSDGLRNGRCAGVAVRTVDTADNVGEASLVAIGKPVPVFDYFEYYKEAGGAEDGGFCFIATAAHGSYAHPVVRVLRSFRDRVMKATPLGTALVALYYRSSPPIAARIAADEDARAIVRGALIPVALLALLWLAAPALGLLLVARLLWRRRTARGLASKAAPLLVAALALSVGPREAAAEPIPDGTGWAFSFKGGPYLPAQARVDGEGTAAVPRDVAFDNVFGPDARSNPLYSLGLDLALYQGFGRAGVGGSFGFMQFVGRGVLTVPTDDSLPIRSNDTTVFNILPLTLTGFYRLEWLQNALSVPLLPYVRAGLAYYVWWVTNGTGDVSRWEQGDREVKGMGGKIGLTGSLGVQILLNPIEPSAAHKLRQSSGITGTSLFAEVQLAQVDGLGGDGFDLSDFTWNLGINLDF